MGRPQDINSRSSFEKSRAQEKFKRTLNADENFVLNKEKAKRVDQEKWLALKRFAWPKRQANLHEVN